MMIGEETGLVGEREILYMKRRAETKNERKNKAKVYVGIVPLNVKLKLCANIVQDVCI